MIQTGDWNTDACTKAGEEVLKLNALDPYQAGYKSADYNAEAAAVGNGKAAMELMGQWAPSVQMDQSADKKGLGDDLGWFAFPTVDRWRRRSHRRRRRRQRHRRRRERAAGGGRLPQVLQQRRQPQQAQHRRRRPVHGGRHGGRGHRPEPPGRPRGSRRRRPSCSCTSTRRPPAALSQAFNDATIALFLGESTPEEVCQTLTDAAAAAVGVRRESTTRSTRSASGPASPARSIPPDAIEDGP